MAEINKIESGKIKSLSTRFYYTAGKLCFQIMLIYGEEKIILFKDFTEYKEYQSNHNYLVAAMAEPHKSVPISFLFTSAQKA